MTWIIVGLGNPGPQYAGHRHNVGFMVADRLAQEIGGGFREKFRAHLCRGTLVGKEALVMKPMTWMNLSGTSVGEAATFFKAPVSQVIVIHDELDIAFDQVQVKIGGGHAGHNGLRSIFEHFGKDFLRVRVGIGRPKFGDVTNHVLGNFSSDEQAGLPLVLDKAVAAVKLILQKGALAAQNATNQKPKPPKPPKPKPEPKAENTADPGGDAAVKVEEPKGPPTG